MTSLLSRDISAFYEFTLKICHSPCFLIKTSLSSHIHIPHYTYQKIETVECGCA